MISLLEDMVIGKKTLLGMTTGLIVGFAAGTRLNQYLGIDSYLPLGVSMYLMTSIFATSGNREDRRDLGYDSSS